MWRAPHLGKGTGPLILNLIVANVYFRKPLVGVLLQRPCQLHTACIALRTGHTNSYERLRKFSSMSSLSTLASFMLTAFPDKRLRQSQW